jgi:hypothetical protein
MLKRKEKKRFGYAVVHSRLNNDLATYTTLLPCFIIDVAHDPGN